MYPYILLALFYLLCFIGSSLMVAIKFETWWYAIACLAAWMLSYTLIKIGEKGYLLGLSSIYRFGVKHARIVSLLLFLLFSAMYFSYIVRPDMVLEELAASGLSEFVFWTKQGSFSGFLGGHCFFFMSFWLLDQGAI